MKQQFVVGKRGDFPEGRCRVVSVGGREIGVINSGGAYYAVQNMCPHRLAKICLGTLGGTLLPADEPGEFFFGMDGQVLRCPWHGWEFDIRTGDTVGGIDRRRLATFPVSLDGDQIIVTMQVRVAAG